MGTSLAVLPRPSSTQGRATQKLGVPPNRHVWRGHTGPVGRAVTPARQRAEHANTGHDEIDITAGPNAGGLVVYSSDPDGYTLELFQPPR